MIVLNAGCQTYLGYHKEEVAGTPVTNVQSTKPPHRLDVTVKPFPTKSRRTLDVEVGAVRNRTLVTRTEFQEIRRDKYLRYHPAEKAGEFFFSSWASLLFGPFYLFSPPYDAWYQFYFPPADLSVKLAGGEGFHGPKLMRYYDENAPSYWTRVSQNTLTGFFNPFQCVMHHYPEQIAYEDSVTSDALRVEEEFTSETAKNSAPGLPVRAVWQAYPTEPLFGETGENGLTQIDMMPWRSKLTAGGQVRITVSTTDGKLSAEEKVALSADELIAALDAVQESGSSPPQTESGGTQTSMLNKHSSPGSGL